MLSLFCSGCRFNYISFILNKVTLFIVYKALFTTGICFSGLLFATPQVSLSNLPDDVDVVGQDVVVTARRDDTLSDLAQRYGLGRSELQWANPLVDPWNVATDQFLTLPLRWILPPEPRIGIVINLPELRLYNFVKTTIGNVSLASYPVSIGRQDWQTPVGQLNIVERLKDPDWRPTLSVRQDSLDRGVILPPLVMPGPLNPLGRYALRLSKRRYLIHGTNKPAGIGMRVSYGCIRLYPEDIETLFRNTTTNSDVTIINQPIKVGRSGNKMFVEVHPPLEEFPLDDVQLVRQASQFLNARVEEINSAGSGAGSGPEWFLHMSPDKLLKAIKEKSGRPTLVALLRGQ